MVSLPWQGEEPLLGFGVLGELLCGSQAMQHVLQFSLYMALLPPHPEQGPSAAGQGMKRAQCTKSQPCC